MFKSAIKYKDDYYDAYYNLGCVYMELGYYKKAIDLFENMKEGNNINEKEINDRINECKNLLEVKKK